ncbi:mediator of RNA polymerase II transcription subunit 10-like isoform X2 [Zophobas morio]
MELTLENLPAELSSLMPNFVKHIQTIDKLSSVDIEIPGAVIDYIDEGQSSDAFFRDHLLQTMQGCRVAKGRVEAFEKFQESLQSEVNIQFPLLLEAYQQSEAIFTQTREQQ